MSSKTRAEELAERFEAINNEFIALVEGCSDENWRKVSEGEEWSVGVIANHIAAGHAGIASFAQRIATQQPVPPLTPEAFEASNQKQAKEAANCTQAEVLELARNNGTQAISIVSSLNDEQLQHSAHFFGRSMSAEGVIEHILIGHVQGHLASIKATV